MGGINDRNISRSANIDAGKIAWPYLLDPKYSDGTLPRMVWVGAGGVDNSTLATRDFPMLTLKAAVQYRTVDGRGDVVALGPKKYNETLDIGATNFQKRNLKIIGTGGGHTGVTQIVGDGTSSTPTIRVQTGYSRGFVLANVELDSVTTSDAGRTMPILELVTSDTGTLTAASSDYHTKLSNVHINSDTTPNVGILLSGATKVWMENIEVAGCVYGIGFRGSVNNNPDNVLVTDVIFHDNVTADIASLNDAGYGSESTANHNASNVWFRRAHFMDVGGTPVTNYLNWPATGSTTVNCGIMESWWARDIANGTLIVTLPTNFVIQGFSAAGAEAFVG